MEKGYKWGNALLTLSTFGSLFLSLEWTANITLEIDL